MLAEFDKGIAKLESAMREQLLTALEKTAIDLLKNAELARKYHSLTGNTLTSYMVGLYEDGKLASTISIMDVSNLKSPTRNKLSQGEGRVKYFEDYDTGRMVTVRRENLLKTDEGYGMDTSLAFLSSFSPDGKGYSMVFTTGTEYSTFIENVKGFNILTETMLQTANISLSNLKSVPLTIK